MSVTRYITNMWAKRKYWSREALIQVPYSASVGIHFIIMGIRHVDSIQGHVREDIPAARESKVGTFSTPSHSMTRCCQSTNRMFRSKQPHRSHTTRATGGSTTSADGCNCPIASKAWWSWTTYTGYWIRSTAIISIPSYPIVSSNSRFCDTRTWL